MSTRYPRWILLRSPHFINYRSKYPKILYIENKTLLVRKRLKKIGGFSALWDFLNFFSIAKRVVALDFKMFSVRKNFLSPKDPFEFLALQI